MFNHLPQCRSERIPVGETQTQDSAQVLYSTHTHTQAVNICVTGFAVAVSYQCGDKRSNPRRTNGTEQQCPEYVLPFSEINIISNASAECQENGRTASAEHMLWHETRTPNEMRSQTGIGQKRETLRRKKSGDHSIIFFSSLLSRNSMIYKNNRPCKPHLIHQFSKEKLREDTLNLSPYSKTYRGAVQDSFRAISQGRSRVHTVFVCAPADCWRKNCPVPRVRDKHVECSAHHAQTPTNIHTNTQKARTFGMRHVCVCVCTQQLAHSLCVPVVGAGGLWLRLASAVCHTHIHSQSNTNTHTHSNM